MASRTVAMLLSSPIDVAVWRAAFASQGLVGASIPGVDARGVGPICLDPRVLRADALMVDVPVLAGRGISLASLVARLRRESPGLKLVARLPSRPVVSRAEATWAASVGVDALLPGQSVEAIESSLLPSVERLLRLLGKGDADGASLRNFLRVMGAGSETPAGARIGRAHALRAWLAGEKIDLHTVPGRLVDHGGLEIRERSHHGRRYRDCFVGAEAIAGLRRLRDFARRSPLAIAEAMTLHGSVHHVLREHDFGDTPNYFRFGGDLDSQETIDLARTIRHLTGPDGPSIRNRPHLGTLYENCFVGSEAVDLLVASHRISIGEAEALGQHLIDLGVIRHVTGERGFIDGNYFYRFLGDREC